LWKSGEFVAARAAARREGDLAEVTVAHYLHNYENGARLRRCHKGEGTMRATVKDHIVAQSNDIVECQGYQYFLRAAVRMDWLEKAEKTESDRACPHGVQFYDVVIDGKRHARAAWSYEAPQPKMQQVADRFGFWEDVEVK
jgi:uncharacterized protein (DUF427 family)